MPRRSAPPSLSFYHISIISRLSIVRGVLPSAVEGSNAQAHSRDLFVLLRVIVDTVRNRIFAFQGVLNSILAFSLVPIVTHRNHYKV